MVTFPLLSLITFLPLVGVALVLWTARGADENVVARNARATALWTTLATFFISLILWFGFDAKDPSFQFTEKADWIPALGMGYHVGVDGLSMPFVLLSTFLTPLCIIASWTAIRTRVKEYMIAFLVLETMMVGMFCALDMVLFYIFFEGVLIPMFLIIGVWGGPQRIYAAFKFFLYTLLGSVLMLLAVLVLYNQAGTTDIPALLAKPVALALQPWLWLAFFASFAVKIPMWPLHTWLPDAHVEAPTAGSVILAGVLLKMGGYGFLRFSIPLFPDASQAFAPLMFTLSLVAIVSASLVALVQQDMKKLIAYSSIAHMGFVTLGIFTLTPQGIQGAMFQMLSHGVVAGALFLGVGVLYDRLHTREIARFGGVVTPMPRFALVFMIFTLAALGLPGTSGFVGEFLCLLGAFKTNIGVTAIASLGIILGAAYMLWLYRRVIFGAVVHQDVAALPDLTPREIGMFLPLIAVVFWLGVYPAPVLDIMATASQTIVDASHAALEMTKAKE